MKAAKQAILAADPSQIPQTLTNTNTTTIHSPGVRLTKAGVPKNKPGPKPGSHRTPKSEKSKPSTAEIEQQRARGVGQPEALALLAEHFASGPARQISPVKREMREEEVENPGLKRKKGYNSETSVTSKDESGAEMRAIKKMKKSRLSQGQGTSTAGEGSTLAPPVDKEGEETLTSPAKKQKKNKASKEERNEKKENRKSDVSMKDATPVTSPISTPIPTSTSKSRKEKGRFADKSHPYKRPEKHGKTRTPSKNDIEDNKGRIAVNGEDIAAGGEEIYETEDITAEVDEKMRRHRARVVKEERAKALGINPGVKHKRESFGTAGPSPKHSQESIQDSSTSAKKRKVKQERKSKRGEEEDVKFKGVVGDIERKRKSPSPSPNGTGVEILVEKKGRSAEEKKKRKEEKAKKRARQQAWKGEQVESMGDVVMSGGGYV